MGEKQNEDVILIGEKESGPSSKPFCKFTTLSLRNVDHNFPLYYLNKLHPGPLVALTSVNSRTLHVPSVTLHYLLFSDNLINFNKDLVPSAFLPRCETDRGG